MLFHSSPATRHSPLTTHHSPLWDRLPETARASLLILTTLMLTGLCTLLACKDKGRRSGRADLDLLDDSSSLNLNLTSADACAAEAAPAVPSDSVRSTAVGCFQNEPAVVAAPPQILELDGFALPTAAPSWESFAIPTRHHGDSPMMRNWKLLGLDLILVGALATPLAAGQRDGPQDEANKEALVLKEVRDLKTSIDALTKAIKSLQESSTTTGVQLQKTQEDINGLKRQVAQLQQEEMDGLRRQIAQLLKDVDDLRVKTARTSAYQPQPPATPTGRVRIVNIFTVPATVIVNTRAYAVNPGTVVMSDPVPAGFFNYEVVGVQAMVSRTLAANETFTITIHP